MRRLPLEYGGRAVGKPAGSHIADLVGLQKAIVLCWKCRPKFSHKSHGYYRDQRFAYISGKCDGCRDYAPQGNFYIHESSVCGPKGQTHVGSVWIPG